MGHVAGVADHGKDNPPAAAAIIRVLLARITELDLRVAEIESRLALLQKPHATRRCPRHPTSPPQTRAGQAGAGQKSLAPDATELPTDRTQKEMIDRLLLRGMFSGNPKLVGMCGELDDHRQCIWTLLGIEGIEPTNHASERALRPAVISRKLSVSTQIAVGSRLAEMILTVVATWLR
jgi:hypothetical protein